ncbi:M23 family metallopeptidase [Ornithobacterium rhinotracheale]|uniref:M23 family metallopeptidase n=1 Tax=Ornithobacterium rhinotracheale TaxID=28251 RepID=UPI00129CE4E0|nr:M23 family metallopeptidase [Ornithobacterium rhinotracheale]MRJ09039.1 M23 family metallopeptidase [Ornithobacterium rhinotracheale]UOH77811.1 M23 family metallopeptidase [Ornithobacterium rhinotracheale]
MKRNINIRYFFFSALFLLVNVANAQFNTISKKPFQEQEFEVSKKGENNVTEEKEKKPDKKKRKFRLFKSNSKRKSELQQELDSLKNILVKKGLEGLSNNYEFDTERIEDSIVSIVTKKISQIQVKKQSQPRIFDNIEEPTIEEEDLKIAMPIDNKIYITSPFGVRAHPIFGSTRMHNGIDIRAKYEYVRSVLDGEVVEAGWDSKGGGNYIKIKHSDRFETAYMHLSQIYYKVGEKVKAGFIIAKSGNSGNSTAPHLHFAVKEYGKFINPTKFLNQLINANNLIQNQRYYGKK